MNLVPVKIISGGQTGVDRGALDAALAAGISCGGWCPRGRKAEDGPIHKRYPLKETTTDNYLQRTKLNIQDSDATLIIYFSELEGGTARTVEYCKELGRPHVLIDMDIHDVNAAVLMIHDFVQAYSIRVLNIAGPRASKNPLAEVVTRQLITGFIRLFQKPE